MDEVVLSSHPNNRKAVKMFQKGGPLRTFGFLVAADLEEGVDPNKLANRLAEGIWHIAGVGNIDVEMLGEVEVVPEAEGV